MALTDRLMNTVRTQLPGAADTAIHMELFNVVDELCREGHVWVETLTQTLVDGENTYDITPEGTEILRVVDVTHETVDVSDVMFDFGQLTLVSGTPTAADVAQPLYISVVLAPAITEGADIESLIPSDMWSEHHQALVSGVLGRMMLHPAKPYSNPSLGQVRTRQFKSAIPQARHKVRSGGLPGAQFWRFPRHTR